ncbi:HTH-type transcriptional regulator SrpR [Oxobacter pfennigii]|uniref:HTH-type transcriptional regulator SrpR n=1 Tax=Oxobacter pfennigii TaxID=36849 RepID=A0A0P8WAF5_9CLOT|nr:TetR/AcrR family transcriptional regulator [Oxobacter pfennigii]KPU45597.1 HTH-type transcriptional regulator SrpR [Oxobacter pfennigii]
MNEQLTKRKIQAEGTKRRIYETSIYLIKQNGYNNVSIDEICMKCGITKGAFYHHFNSKEDIIVGIGTDMNYDMQDYYENILYEKDNISKILALTKYYFKFISAIGLDISRQLNKIIVDGKHGYFISGDKNIEKILWDSIIAGQKSGEIKKHLSVENITFFIHSLVLGISMDWCANEGDYDIEEKGCKAFCELISIIKA